MGRFRLQGVSRLNYLYSIQSAQLKIGTQWVLVSDAIGIVLKIVVFLLTADEGITVRALSSLVFFLVLGMTLVC